MGQKVHPKGLRLGIIREWDSRWFAGKKEFSDTLVEDVKIRRFVKRVLYNAGVPRIEIERAANRVKVIVHAAKPGMVIGKQGAGIEDLRIKLQQLTGKNVSVDVKEVRTPDADAQLVAESIAQQLEKRISFRRAVRQAVGRSMRMGAKGIRVMVSGRIGGAEIARKERDNEGTVPLHTLRADIEYGFAEATTTYGKIGVKIWIYRGAEPAPGQRPQGGFDRDRGGRRGGDGRPQGGRGPGGPGGGRGGRGPGGPTGGRRG